MAILPLSSILVSHNHTRHNPLDSAKCPGDEDETFPRQKICYQENLHHLFCTTIFLDLQMSPKSEKEYFTRNITYVT